MSVILYRLKKNGRAAVVVPDGFLFGLDNAKVNIKKKLIGEFNLHTVVRLPGSVFSPYTSITTNLLFFDNTKPTTETWFYRVDIPSDRKHFSKTKPMELKHFDDCIAWWNNREVIPDGEYFKAQKYTADYLLNEQGCNIDLCGYPHEEEEVLAPADLIQKYEEKRASLNAEIDRTILALSASLNGEPVNFDTQGTISSCGKMDDLHKRFPEDMKKSILQYAIQGKLVEQRLEEGTGAELYKQMQAEKQRLIKEKKIKKEKTLVEITDDEIPFDIPETWIWIRVGDVGSWGSGATPPRTNPAYYGGSIPWLKTGDLNDGFIKEVPEFITELALEKTSVRLNPVGSVLMAMYGATIGKLGILEIPVTTNQACCACIPYAGMYNKYLFYYLMSMRQTYIGMAEGGAQPNISKEKIVNSILPLPPLEEQHRIVAKLEEILPLCERLK